MQGMADSPGAEGRQRGAARHLLAHRVRHGPPPTATDGQNGTHPEPYKPVACAAKW